MRYGHEAWRLDIRREDLSLAHVTSVDNSYYVHPFKINWNSADCECYICAGACQIDQYNINKLLYGVSISQFLRGDIVDCHP